MKTLAHLALSVAAIAAVGCTGQVCPTSDPPPGWSALTSTLVMPDSNVCSGGKPKAAAHDGFMRVELKGNPSEVAVRYIGFLEDHGWHRTSQRLDDLGGMAFIERDGVKLSVAFGKVLGQRGVAYALFSEE